MPDSSPTRRPTVLLLAGDVRDEWTRALSAGGLEVATTGWLDGVTAARVRRPDAVLVSTDLPENAPQVVCGAFRGAVDLFELPIVVAGSGAESLDQQATAPSRADHYVAAPIDAATLPGRIQDAIRAGSVPSIRGPVRPVWIGLVAFSLVAATIGPIALRLAWQASWLTQRLLFGVALASFGAVIAVGIAARTRPLNPAEQRNALAWLGLFLWQVGALVPGGGMGARGAGVSLGLVACAGWAWLGPKAKPRTPGVARAFHALAAGLLLLAVGVVKLVAWLAR